MKKKTQLIIILSVMSLFGFTQEELNLDLITTPNSPAFTIMGIEPTSIDEPTSPADIFISVQNATSNFSKIPTAYSLSFSPGWIFGGEEISFDEFISNKTSIAESLKQNSTFSFGIAPMEGAGDSISNLGIGVRLSFLRGKIDSNDSTHFKDLHEVYLLLEKIQTYFADRFASQLYNNKSRESYEKRLVEIMLDIDSIETASIRLEQEKIKLKNENSLEEQKERLIISEQLKILKNDKTEKKFLVVLYKDSLLKIMNEISKDLSAKTYYTDSLMAVRKVFSEGEFEKLTKIAEDVKFNRIGFKLDLALAYNAQFSANSFDFINSEKIGAWVTASYVGKSTNDKGDKISSKTIMGTCRIFNSYDKDYLINSNSDNSGETIKTNPFSFDYGGRFIIKSKKEKLAFSTELLSRYNFGNKIITENTWKMSLSAEYEIVKNTKLTFTVGKDFESDFETGGNLITALNLVKAFGTARLSGR